jgi:uncharacterized protein
MLIEFSVGNFRSIREIVTLSMIATTLDSKPKDGPLNTENVIPVAKDLSLLRSAVIYGANASGKSNLIKAFSFFKQFVLDSARESTAGDPIPTEPFLFREDMRTAPSHFEVVFLDAGVQYRYGFEVNKEIIIKEWLYYTPEKREKTLFIRENDEIHIPSHSEFRNARDLIKHTRSNALFLSVATQFNINIAHNIYDNIYNCSFIREYGDAIHFSIDCIEKEKYKNQIVDLFYKLNLEIGDIFVEKHLNLLPISQGVTYLNREGVGGIGNYKIQTQHSICDIDGEVLRKENFDMDTIESEGTKKIISLCGPLFDVLTYGSILFIDEIDSSLHSLLTKAIIGLFNSTETNPNGAQLICATHDTNLLDSRKLRRDQIYFTEKEDGATRLYSLAEFKIDGKRVRAGESYEDNYIQGRYGAIPYLGDLRKLFVTEKEQEEHQIDKTAEAVA